MTDLSIWTLRKWVNECRIRSYRFGGAVRIKESELIKFAKVTPSVDELIDDLEK